MKVFVLPLYLLVRCYIVFHYRTFEFKVGIEGVKSESDFSKSEPTRNILSEIQRREQFPPSSINPSLQKISFVVKLQFLFEIVQKYEHDALASSKSLEYYLIFTKVNKHCVWKSSSFRPLAIEKLNYNYGYLFHQSSSWYDVKLGHYDPDFIIKRKVLLSLHQKITFKVH